MAEENEVVEPVGAENEADVLARILDPSTPQPEPVVPSEGECQNCANNGKVSKLTDGECPNCGFHV